MHFVMNSRIVIHNNALLKKSVLITATNIKNHLHKFVHTLVQRYKIPWIQPANTDASFSLIPFLQFQREKQGNLFDWYTVPLIAVCPQSRLLLLLEVTPLFLVYGSSIHSWSELGDCAWCVDIIIICIAITACMGRYIESAWTQSYSLFANRFSRCETFWEYLLTIAICGWN